MTLAQTSIRTRLGLGFGLVLVLLIAVAATSLARLAESNRNVEALAQVSMAKLVASSQAVETILRTARSTGDMFLLDDEAQIKREIASVRQNQGKVKEMLDTLETSVAVDGERALFRAIVQARDAYIPSEDEFLKIASGGDYASAKDVLLQRARPAQSRYVEAIRAFALDQVSRSAEEARHTAADFQFTRTLIVTLAAAAVGLGVLFSWWITSSIVGPIREAVSAAQRVANGDLTMHVQARSSGRDETGHLLQALRSMTDNLRMLVGEVAGRAHTVSDTSTQIAQGNLDMSQRTEEQASTLEETAVNRAADVDRRPERRKRASGQPACRRRKRSGAQGRPRRQPGGRNHDRHFRIVAPDVGHHRRD